MIQRIKEIAMAGLASRPVSAVMSPLLRDRACIFMLHRFRDPTSGLRGTHDPAVLRACLGEVRRARAPVLSLDELVTRVIDGDEVKPGTIAFTMDDGFWDQGEIGAETFLEFDIPVTIFLITGLQDETLWPWDDRLAWIYEHSRAERLSISFHGHRLAQVLSPNLDQRRSAMRETRSIFKTLPFIDLEPSLTALAQHAEVAVPERPPRIHRGIGWDNARSLERRGIDFGPHSVSHGIISRMTESQARTELLEAWQRLKTELQDPVSVYGWPTGRASDFGPREISILREAGFRAAVATGDNYADLKQGEVDAALFRLQRFGLPNTLGKFVSTRSWVGRARNALKLN